MQAAGLSKAFEGNVVLDGVSFDVLDGQVILLEGDNGSGKTTLLNILTGNLEPDLGTISYLMADRPRTYDFPRSGLRRLIPFAPEVIAKMGLGRGWQDTRLFGSLSLRDNIAVAVPDQPGENPVLAFAPGAGAAERKVVSRADAALDQLGLGDRRHSTANAISLGQSKRVAVARAAAGGARVLLLDEPLAGLDEQGIAEVVDLLRTLVRSHGVTLIVVEHSLNHHHLNGLVTTRWELGKGRLTISAAENVAPGASRPADSKSGQPAWFTVFAQGGARVIETPLPRGARLLRFARPGVDPNPVLEVDDIGIRRGERVVVGRSEDPGDGIDLVLFDHEIAVLQAPNGWGKTSLLMGLVGLVPTFRGRVRLAGRDLQRVSTWRRVRAGLRYIPSQDAIFPSLTGADLFRLTRRRMPAEAGGILMRPIGHLSGGQRQRLALDGFPAGGLAHLYDEPFAGLDEQSVRWAAENIRGQIGRCALVALPSI